MTKNCGAIWAHVKLKLQKLRNCMKKCTAIHYERFKFHLIWYINDSNIFQIFETRPLDQWATNFSSIPLLARKNQNMTSQNKEYLASYMSGAATNIGKENSLWITYGTFPYSGSIKLVHPLVEKTDVSFILTILPKNFWNKWYLIFKP